MAKKITFGSNLKDKKEKEKKNKRIASKEADNWVEGDVPPKSAEDKETSTKKSPKKQDSQSNQDNEKLVKFTIDIPISLRTKIKTKCAVENVPMRERVQKLLEDYFM
jgi:hypothetical protein